MFALGPLGAIVTKEFQPGNGFREGVELLTAFGLYDSGGRRVFLWRWVPGSIWIYCSENEDGIVTHLFLLLGESSPHGGTLSERFLRLLDEQHEPTHIPRRRFDDWCVR